MHNKQVVNNIHTFVGTPLQNFVEDVLTLTRWLANGQDKPLYQFTRDMLLVAQDAQEDIQIEMMQDFMLRRRKATHTPEILESK